MLDNSVDGAWRSLGHTAPSLKDSTIDLGAYRIDIEAKSASFSIRDNCGGMTLERAEKYAFTFGRKTSVKRVEAAREELPNPDGEFGTSADPTDETSGEADYRIGVYGIGMKRAVFKLGNAVTVKSSYSEAGVRKAFQVPIDVPRWMAETDTDWKFDILPDEPDKEDGLLIQVGELSRGTRAAFSNEAFLQNLRRVVERDYSIHLTRGLKVFLNDEPLEAWPITLLQGKEFAPVNKSWDIALDGGSVRVELLAGAGAAPPDEEAPDEDDRGEQRYGWYVACNGRIVLAADKTSLSVWGADDFPMWHRQYRGFLGIILFTSEDTSLLPLTTTKRSVDVSSDVYRQAKAEMRTATRAWIDYTNARKQARDRAKMAEATARSVSIFRVPERAAVATPVFRTGPRVKVSSIQFSQPVLKIRKLGEAFGSLNMPATQVGSRSFEYAYDELVGED